MELEILGARPNPVDGATGVCNAPFSSGHLRLAASREVRDRSRDLQPFHPGCGCVVLVIDDASTSPPAGRVPRYVDSFFTRLRKSSTRAGALAAHHHLVVPKLCLLRAHSGAFRPADVVTHVLNGSHLRTGSAGVLDGSRAVIEGSGRLETLRYKCSAGNEIMHLN